MQLRATSIEANVQVWPEGQKSRVSIWPAGPDEFGEYIEARLWIDNIPTDWNTVAGKMIRQTILEGLQD